MKKRGWSKSGLVLILSISLLLFTSFIAKAEEAKYIRVTPAKFEKSVVEGLPDVTWHTFGNLLTPEDVSDVTNYVRSLIR